MVDNLEATGGFYYGRGFTVFYEMEKVKAFVVRKGSFHWLTRITKLKNSFNIQLERFFCIQEVYEIDVFYFSNYFALISL